ncbi:MULTISPECIES: methylated-DNA--[protein]-cysteine S-methyltransferase [unclassified Frigoribacterium]|uniref:methylated-DNA--[protein]-cysteine S-methyltransferase n=1 Tax=unclassified Frigoribacterium TaxID=2627005 RepID=UPI0006F7F272|nr:MULTISPECIES: methylated-DNA--[protein]-cysteine S-methyltransferase [unclassified Frigoribacterium]KQM25740.1 cysteine methyltransferase [Frigoribacterium sp. Leaf8]WAC51213.1 methylated-DNA--[protein]-cysteine S-methyltransferase [Frigoribacterium sp. SL97]
MTASPIDASTDPGDLLTSLDPTDERLAALRARFAETALGVGAVDVAYRTLDSPVGLLLLCATDVGVLRVAFEIEGHDTVLDRLASTVSPRIVEAPSRLDTVARELDEYFRGERRAFDLPLDRRLSTGFQRTVLEHLPDIGYGSTTSYAAVALASGSPRAVRAVGTACATNPLPLVVPCHRVVRSDGTSGNYRGGMAAKQILIDLEAGA